MTCHVDTFERHLHVFHLEKLGYVCNKGSHIKDGPRHDERVRTVVASRLAQWNFTTFNIFVTIYISTFLSQKFIEMVSTKFIHAHTHHVLQALVLFPSLDLRKGLDAFVHH